MPGRHGELSLTSICEGVVVSDKDEGSALLLVETKK
jgi:hypothetical protein